MWGYYDKEISKVFHENDFIQMKRDVNLLNGTLEGENPIAKRRLFVSGSDSGGLVIRTLDEGEGNADVGGGASSNTNDAQIVLLKELSEVKDQNTQLINELKVLKVCFFCFCFCFDLKKIHLLLFYFFISMI